MKLTTLTKFSALGALVTSLSSCVFFPPLFTEYNLCDKMDAWGKDEAYWWGQKPRTARFYELNGIYYEEVPTVYKAVSKPIRIMEFKGHDEWPKETARALYTEVYYGALTPQQVKDYLGKDAAPLPTDTPMLLHERDFNKAAARRLSMTDSALRRIYLSPQNPRHLPWPLRICPPDKRSIGNYLRMPVTYTVGPALNVVLWTGEGVLTGLVGTASAVSLLFDQLQQQKTPATDAADDSAKQASAER